MRMGGQRHAPTVLPPGKRPSTHCGWAHRAGLNVLGKSRPHQDSIPRRPARRQSLYQLRYPGNPFV